MDIGKSLRAFAEKMNDSMFGGKPFTYPKDHKMGMIVPYGGSMCGNCRFLSEDHKHCQNKVAIVY